MDNRNRAGGSAMQGEVQPKCPNTRTTIDESRPSTSMTPGHPQIQTPRPQSRPERKNTDRNSKFQKKANGNSAPRGTTNVDKPPPQRVRPTHFLALPLHNHSALRDRISAFHSALFTPPFGGSQTAVGSTPPPNDQANEKPIKTEIRPSEENLNAKGKGRKKPTVSPSIGGLDTSIVIDPRRMHMTLGVMALEFDVEPEAAKNSDQSFARPDPPQLADSSTSSIPKKTVATALSLLASIKPHISEILGGTKGVDVPLETMHVLKTTRISSSPRDKSCGPKPEALAEPSVTLRETGPEAGKDDVLAAVGPSRYQDPRVSRDKLGAGVLYLAPRTRKLEIGDTKENDEYRKLVQISELIHKTFKDAGYLTDTRPLTLHCTILNASHRKPARRIPFSYTDILESDAIKLLKRTSSDLSEPLPEDKLGEGSSSNDAVAVTLSQADDDTALAAALPNPLPAEAPPKPQPKFRPPITILPPLAIDLGTVRVNEVQLWVMGSHGPNNEYVNCGGIVLE